MRVFAMKRKGVSCYGLVCGILHQAYIRMQALCDRRSCYLVPAAPPMLTHSNIVAFHDNIREEKQWQCHSHICARVMICEKSVPTINNVVERGRSMME